MLNYEVIQVLAQKIKTGDNECLFRDVVEDFLECEYFCDGQCILSDILECILLSENDKQMIEGLLEEVK